MSVLWRTQLDEGESMAKSQYKGYFKYRFTDYKIKRLDYEYKKVELELKTPERNEDDLFVVKFHGCEHIEIGGLYKNEDYNQGNFIDSVIRQDLSKALNKELLDLHISTFSGYIEIVFESCEIYFNETLIKDEEDIEEKKLLTSRKEIFAILQNEEKWDEHINLFVQMINSDFRFSIEEIIDYYQVLCKQTEEKGWNYYCNVLDRRKLMFDILEKNFKEVRMT